MPTIRRRLYPWLYPRLYLLVLLLLTVGCQAAAAADGPVDLNALEREAHDRINAHRKASKLATFSYNDEVATIARGHSQKMADGTLKLGHDGFQARADAMGKILPLAGAAENVSKHQRKSGFAEAAVKGWLASKVHRKNIDGDYEVTGVGVARSKEGVVYFTQLFVRQRK